MQGTYKIIDEPRPSAVSRLAVNPLWIFLGSLFGGAGIGLCWFAFNSFAISSAARTRELAYVFIGLLGTPFIFAALNALMNLGWLDTDWIPYLRVLVTGFQLLIVYLLHLSQHKSYELYSLFGGVAKNGLLLVVALFLIRPYLAEFLGPWSVLFL